jgi:hypothetical protein
VIGSPTIGSDVRPHRVRSCFVIIRAACLVLPGKPTARRAQSSGGNRMTEKRTPAAETQRETVAGRPAGGWVRRRRLRVRLPLRAQTAIWAASASNTSGNNGPGNGRARGAFRDPSRLGSQSSSPCFSFVCSPQVAVRPGLTLAPNPRPSADSRSRRPGPG